MFDIKDNDYVAATFAIQVLYFESPASMWVAAWFSEEKQQWQVLGRLLVEHSLEPFDENDQRFWFKPPETPRSEAEAVDVLRQFWKECQRQNRKDDKEAAKQLEKHHGFRLVRGQGVKALLRAMNTIPGFRQNFILPDGETDSFEQGDLPEEYKDLT
jgi:hypothetical protein